MSFKKIRKQISASVLGAPSKQDSNGDKDIDPLLNNCQGTVEKEEKELSQTTKNSSPYKQPIHPIPSSQIVLNEEEKLEFEAVIFEMTLESVGLRVKNKKR